MSDVQVATPETTERLRRLGLMMMGSLLIEFIGGIAVTLWVETPESGSGWSAASPKWLLMAHVIWGALVLLLGLWILIVARKGKSRTWLNMGAFGFVGIIIAFTSGNSYMSDVSSDASSFIMAIGFAIALFFYSFGLFKKE
jgi:uncharacterized membrane protein